MNVKQHLHIELPRQNQDLFLPSRHTVITTKKEKVKGDLPSTSSIIFYLNSKNISGLNTGILMKFVRMESQSRRDLRRALAIVGQDSHNY
jgi:hypothetical protein